MLCLAGRGFHLVGSLSRTCQQDQQNPPGLVSACCLLGQQLAMALFLLTFLIMSDLHWNPQMPISKCWIYSLKQKQTANPRANKTWRERVVCKLGLNLPNEHLHPQQIQSSNSWVSKLKLCLKIDSISSRFAYLLAAFHLLLPTSPSISAIAHTTAKALKKPLYLAHLPARQFCFFHLFNKELSSSSFYCLVIYSAAITK